VTRDVTVCTGSFVLARAGVLDGRRAACHWRWADLFRAEFPEVNLLPDVLYVEDGAVWTSAGSAAALDLSLALIERDHGSRVAHAVSKRLVFALHRDGGQRQFIEPRLMARSGAVAISEAASPAHEIARTMAWARERLDEPLDVGDLARHTNVAASTLHRWFRDATGTSPLQWLRAERVSEALRLLETTDRPVEHVASLSGLGSAANLRALVRRRTGLTPLAYRRNYRKIDGAERLVG
jgi:AraC family transcriptional regulator, transcriptional activator FtrA